MLRLCIYFVALLLLYCALRPHFRCKRFTNTLLHYITWEREVNAEGPKQNGNCLGTTRGRHRTGTVS